MAALPPTFRKLVCQKLTNKFAEAVKIVSCDMVEPGPDQVLVQNRFMGINASDINFTAGFYMPGVQPPFDTGFEAVGKVVKTGANAAGFKVGQPVMYSSFGAFSEFQAVDSASVIPIPDAAAHFLPLLVSGLTATLALDKVGDLKATDTVLVTAAAGGTGQFAVQWAKLKGCKVFGTCSTDDKCKFLKDIGCDRPINYKKEDLNEVLQKECPNGVDVVYECVGGKTFETAVMNLGQHGRLVIIGMIETYQGDGIMQGGSAKVLASIPIKILKDSSSLRGFFLPHFRQHFPEYLKKMMGAMQKGELKSLVDKGQNAASPFVNGLDDVTKAVEMSTCTVCEYRLSHEEHQLSPLRELVDQSPNDVCAICLGMFSSPFLNEIANQIKQDLSEKGYDSDDYCLAIGAPFSVEVREKVAIRTREVTSNIDVKLALKHLLGLLLSDLGIAQKYNPSSYLQITVAIMNEAALKADHAILHTGDSEAPAAKRKKLTKKSDLQHYLKLAAGISSLSELPDCTTKCTFTVTSLHSAIILGGRYNKYSRFLNQTPWMVDGKAMTEISVEEIICGPVAAALRGSGYSFTTSGREDADVRMLGRGRPFMIAVEDPKMTKYSPESLLKMKSEINLSKDVAISPLSRLSQHSTQQLKVAEETKRKHYVALCFCPEPTKDEHFERLLPYADKELVVTQKTPLRVLHRRSVTSRDKVIHKMSYIRCDDYHFQLFLVTQAGTYIKEFVHGDLGRTEPSLGEVMGLRDLDIVELDVGDVEMEWP